MLGGSTSRKPDSLILTKILIIMKRLVILFHSVWQERNGGITGMGDDTKTDEK
jgi:hypothetical protein